MSGPKIRGVLSSVSIVRRRSGWRLPSVLGLLALALVLALPATSCTRTLASSTAEPVSKAAPAKRAPDEAEPTFELTRLRHGHRTEVFFEVSDEPAPRPPPEIFERIDYPAPLGDNIAYVSPEREGERRPAIVWIAGGFDWGLGSHAWQPGPRHNDQSATVLREAGLILMLPSLRGSNGNPGRNECFLGEVDDVIAAARHLASRSDVDPDRIYLGGHSTGGTLALLVAASTNLFRGVVAFGPVSDPRNYGEDGCMSPSLEGMEARLRTPTEFLDQIETPTIVIEGIEGGNVGSFGPLEAARGNAPVRLVAVPGANHFDVLAPVSELVARAILERHDFGDPEAIELSTVSHAFAGAEAAITPPALRLVRATSWPRLGRRMFGRAVDEGCQLHGLSAEDCESWHEMFSESVFEAILADAVSREIPADAVSRAVQFYTSPTGAALVEWSLQPESMTPTDAQMQRLEDYTASNPGFESVQRVLFERAYSDYGRRLLE